MSKDYVFGTFLYPTHPKVPSLFPLLLTLVDLIHILLASLLQLQSYKVFERQAEFHASTQDEA